MYCVEYVIQKGDTLYSISRHYGISVSSLMAANPMVNVYNLGPERYYAYRLACQVINIRTIRHIRFRTEILWAVS
jgi:murein DD-endopeptidase MepM/ murein hydrolase activator NlpD